MNKEQLQTAYDSMTARCATLQNKVFSLQSEVAVLGYEKKYCTICEQCGRKSRLISEEQAEGKTFQMTYEATSCSMLSNKWTSVEERVPEAVDIYSDFVLVVDENYDIVVAYYNSADNYWVAMYLNITVRPSHWMSLPKPPKPIEIDGIKKESKQ